MKIPKIEYEVYYSNNSLDLIQLNLTKCKGKKIDISIPVRIDDDIDIYNISSDYYNNICSKTLSDSNIDIPLSDRKNIFIDNNMTLCEEDCTLIEYNKTMEKAICSCLIKIKLPFIEDIKFDKDKLYKSFSDINNVINIKIMKCFKNVFIIKNLIKNYGFYILMSILLLFFIILFLFYCKYYSKLKKEINLIISAKKYFFNQEKKKTTKINRINSSRNKKKGINLNTNKHNKDKNKKNDKNKTKEKKIKYKKNPPKKKSKQMKNKGIENNNNLIFNNSNNNFNSLLNNFSNNVKKLKNNKHKNINNDNLNMNTNSLIINDDDNKN